MAVQLEVDPAVVSSGDKYRAAIDDAAACAVEEAGRADHRFIVFPEIAGHLALLALAPPPAHRAKSLGAALAAAAMRRPLEVLWGAASSRTLAPKHAVLAALAPDGEKYWRSVFGPLARRHDAYVVAGSHLRLSPAGDLTNASMLFAPDGRCIAVTDKVNLVPGMEDGAPGGLGLARGTAEDLPIVDAPFGRVCTLICYDGFAEPHTSLERFVPLGPEIAAKGGVTIAANPSANPWYWDQPWPPKKLVGGMARAVGTRADQWSREGLRASLVGSAFARYGVTAHLVGHVLDLHFDGCSEILERTDDVRVLARAAQHESGGHVVAVVSC
ncbi:MAG: carbon-nitrogen hydrolase family protein [Myxococcota bacterium]|nr:carbon-nitrogen hydrolase family protein [Deltaproteobacteria bacterium]MDQ3341197.1 carbon-nitrogen hydrolase family protein [Myxococcota bacterium]